MLLLLTIVRDREIVQESCFYEVLVVAILYISYDQNQIESVGKSFLFLLDRSCCDPANRFECSSGENSKVEETRNEVD